jgi:hypothetical protein
VNGPLGRLQLSCSASATMMPGGAADVTAAIDVLVLVHLANEFGAGRAQAGKDVFNVSTAKHDAAYAQRVRRCDFR